jgi:NADPH:quinone reductase-like Zn-dependent oxidoreductase
MTGRKKKILGQDPAILAALWANVLSWLVRTLCPTLLSRLLPVIEQEDVPSATGASNAASDKRTRCIVIGRPGGVEQLRLITLKPGIATCGYNVEGQDLPFTKTLVQDSDIPPDCVVLANEAFSVNYADCAIRWGLYESAKEFVGYPICPGFDIAGTVERVGRDVREFRPGDRVFGCTLFGAYSTRVLVPEMHLRKIPDDMPFSEAAAMPTVALTSLYALFLAGHFPTQSLFTNKAILIHSAAGGVGSMLVQMSRLLGLSPVVGVVGRGNKVDAAKALGCDVVIDKSSEDLWAAAEAASPAGYATVMDASGVQTIAQSYEHLAMTGRLIVYGFHTNLPLGKDSLSPIEWIRMGMKMSKMPKFDPMEMGGVNKAVMGFNLSFFANEREMLSSLFSQIITWIEEGKLHCPRVVELPMEEIREAHDLIQSGRTIGKIVLNTSRG